MYWEDQKPQPTTILFECRKFNRDYSPVMVQFDKLPDGNYRATAGNLFGCEEIGRSSNLEMLLKAVDRRFE